MIPYETAVICPQTAVDALAAVVPDLGVQPARRAPRAAGCSAAAAAEDVIVLNDDSGDPNMHALNVPQEMSL